MVQALEQNTFPAHARCSREYSDLDHAATDFVPVSQAVEGAGNEDAGEQAEAIGARAPVGAWTSAAQAAWRGWMITAAGRLATSDRLERPAPGTCPPSRVSCRGGAQCRHRSVGSVMGHECFHDLLPRFCCRPGPLV